jgi:hypothetical protein
MKRFSNGLQSGSGSVIAGLDGLWEISGN